MFLAFLLLPGILFAQNNVTAQSYLLVERDTFAVVTGKNPHQRLAPASTTKIMTTILALERLEGGEIIVPDQNVNSIPRSKLNLIPGKEYKAMDLGTGVMVESANDAAYAVGTYIGGSEDRFATMMTRRAAELGAVDTQFKNASGLYVSGHYSTCHDLAVMLRHALTFEKFREIASMKYFLFQNYTRSVRYKNHNRFLFCFEPAVAGKTGFTRASRHCYAGAFEKDDKVYILAMLGSRDLWGDAVKILGTLYDRLPSDREIRLAKAHSLTLMSYKEKKERPDVPKKKGKKAKKGKKKAVKGQ